MTFRCRAFAVLALPLSSRSEPTVSDRTVGVTVSLRAPRSVFVLLAGVLSLGCAEGGAGPCVHTYRDPVLAITAAVDSGTGVRITPVFVTGVTIDGQSQPVGSLLAVAFGASARGDTVVCGLPCGFGTSEGQYSFTATAPGYAIRRVSVNARFARFDGGCPSSNEGSTEISVSLPRSL